MGEKMAESAKIVSRAEQRFDPEQDRVITVLYGLTNTGETGVLDTVVITVEAFVRCHTMQLRTMEEIQRHSMQKYIESLPKGRRRKASSNVVQLKRG
jgi:polyphosphate kinase 2 (PPK2 family)